MNIYVKPGKSALTFYLATSLVFLLVISALYGYAHFNVKNITIRDIDKVIVMRTLARDVDDVLRKNDIVINESDKITPSVESGLKDGMEIRITRSFPLVLSADGENTTIYTTFTKVVDVLREKEIVVGVLDEVRPALNSTVLEGDTIVVTRVKEEIVVESMEIPYLNETNMTYDLEPGVVETILEGKPGKKEIEFKIRYEDGKIVSKDVVKETVLVEAVNRVMNKGKDKLFVTNRGKPFTISKVLIMKSTAYDLSYASCGKYPDHPEYGITRSGTKAGPGVIAVDPKVIPLGTKVYVESLTGGRDYGFASAEDTGSAIKGNIIDIFIGDNKEALRYGRRMVRVYIIEGDVPKDQFVGFGK